MRSQDKNQGYNKSFRSQYKRKTQAVKLICINLPQIIDGLFVPSHQKQAKHQLAFFSQGS